MPIPLIVALTFIALTTPLTVGAQDGGFTGADWTKDVNANLSENVMAKDAEVLGGQQGAEDTKYLESLAPAGEKQDIESEYPKFRKNAASFLKDANKQGAGVTIENAGKNAFLDTKLANQKKESWLSQNAGKYGLAYRPGVGYVTQSKPTPRTDGGGAGGAAALAGVADALRSLSGLFANDNMPSGPSASVPMYGQPDAFGASGTGIIQNPGTRAGTSTSASTTGASAVVTQFSPDFSGEHDSESEATIKRIATGKAVPIEATLAHDATMTPRAPGTAPVTSQTVVATPNQAYAVLTSNDTFVPPTVDSVVAEAAKTNAWKKFVQDFTNCLKPMQCTASRLQ